MQTKLRTREWLRTLGAATLGASAVVAFNAARASWTPFTSELKMRREANLPKVARDSEQEPGRSSPGSASPATSTTVARSAPSGQLASQLEQVNSKLAGVQQQKDVLQREKRVLEGQLHNLEHEVEERDRYKYDLTQEDWKHLAAEGSVRYRMPCMMPLQTPWKIPQVELDRLGLSPDDGEVLAAAQRRSNQRVWSTMRPLCMQIVDNADVVDLLGPMSCFQLIEKVASRSSVAKVTEARRQVAEVHAGLREPSGPGAERSPVFEGLMVMSSEGKRFEADLAESFGPEEGKRIWQSMSCAATRD